MVSAITSTTTSTSSSSTSSTSSASTDYEMFLKLLCAQLQAQDPLDPMDATEFTQQLVQYSSLEQQISTNDKLDSLVNSLNADSLATGVGYLGHSVEASTDTLSVGNDGVADADWIYDLESGASSVEMKIVDADGNTVWAGEGETGSGRHTFSWDGKDSNGNTVSAGTYSLVVSAADANSNAINASVSIVGTVTGVDSTSDTTLIEIGSTSVDLDSISRITS